MRRAIYGFTVGVFLFVISTAFYCTYQVSQLKAQVQELQTEREDALRANTGAADEGYVLKAAGGCVWVYEGDGETVYESTEILLNSLPDKLQREILAGKHLSTELELYSFLENYSS